jgi:uncharacterized protein (DUF1684 family)
MKLFFTAILCCITLFSCTSVSQSNLSDYQKEINKHRDENHVHYLSKKGPLNKQQRKDFVGLDYFPINEKYRVKAQFTQAEKEEFIILQTSAKKERKYAVAGLLKFALNGKENELTLYKSITEPVHYFLPFTDLTSGSKSYGGGRYMDIDEVKSSEVVLDFNKAYHPYCAYVKGYSCPIPPANNALDIEILAGVKYEKPIF